MLTISQRQTLRLVREQPKHSPFPQRLAVVLYGSLLATVLWLALTL